MKQPRRININDLEEYLISKNDWVLLRDICKHFTTERGHISKLAVKSSIIERRRFESSHETGYRINNYLNE